MNTTDLSLNQLKERMEGIAGAWNGEDYRFSYEGVTFHDVDAGVAKDILIKIKEIKALLEEIESR